VPFRGGPQVLPEPPNLVDPGSNLQQALSWSRNAGWDTDLVIRIVFLRSVPTVFLGMPRGIFRVPGAAAKRRPGKTRFFPGGP
jgi:hypothetical protein